MTNYDALPPSVQETLRKPSSKPPKGVLSNLDNPPNRNKEAIALAVICIILVTISVSVRLYSRLVIVKRMRIEDYLGLIAVLPYIGIAWGFFDYVKKVGFFVHQWDLRGRVIIDVAINSFVMRIVYSLSMVILKTAVLLDWQRIFVLGQTHRAFYWVSTCVLVLNILIHTTGLITSIAACRPIEMLWKFWIKGKCIDRKSRDIANATFNLVIDIFILLLPQKIIWGLNMSRSRRLGISVVFSIGLLTIAAASGRLYSIAVLDYPDRRDLSKPFDTTYLFSQTLIWIQCETTCIFLVFCVPALPKVFAQSGIISQIAMSLRSWTRLGPRTPSNHSEPREWPPTIGSVRNKSRRKENDLSIAAHETHPHDSSIQLATMSDKHNEYAKNGDKSSLDPGIVRTVEFDYQDDAASKTSTTAIMDRQHPWMGH